MGAFTKKNNTASRTPYMRRILSPYVMAFLAVVMWSFSFPASKVAQIDFSPMAIVFLRYLVASIFFLPLLFLGRIIKLKFRDLLRLTLPALIGVTAHQTLVVIGVGQVSPSAAAMIISTTPIFAAILAYVLQGVKLTKRQINGTGLGFSGVVLICTSSGADGNLQGFTIMLAATLCLATYFLMQKALLERYSLFDVVAYNTWIGTLSMSFFAPALMKDIATEPQISSIISVVIMGVFSSGLGVVFWFKAVATSAPNQINFFMYLQPLLVGLMAWVWIADVPSFQTCLGGLIVLYVLFYLTRK